MKARNKTNQMNKTKTKRILQTKNKTRKINKINKINKITSICKVTDDYYTYVNYPWIDSHDEPNSFNYNAFTNLREKVEKDMKKTVLPNMLREKTKDAIKIRNIYYAGLKWNDPLTRTYFYQILNDINMYRKDSLNDPDALYKFMAYCIKNGYGMPINWNITNDVKHPDQYICLFDEPTVTFEMREIYYGHSKNNNKIRHLYLEYLESLFTEMFGLENCYNSKNVLDIEKDLCKYSMSLEEKNLIENNYHIFSAHSLKHKFGFDFNKFCKAMNIHGHPKHIIITNPKAFKHTIALLHKSWNSSEWSSYWTCQILFLITNFHSKLYEISYHFFSMVYERKPMDLATRSLYRVLNYMPTTMSKKYLEFFKNEKARIFCVDLVKRFKKAFKERLKINPWLSEKAKMLAIKKIDKMTAVIGYKHKYEADPDIIFSLDDPIQNKRVLSNWLSDKYIHKIGKRLPADDVWNQNEQGNVFDVNAYYNNTSNQLILPNGILQPSFIDISKSFVYNLAHIGTIIGHEITHAFDDNGCKYNEDGILTNWWLPEDFKRYKERQSSVVKQYEEFSKRDHYKVNLWLTLGENISDIGGFLTAEQVLEDYLVEKGITGDKQNDYFKDFYKFYAEQWRSSRKIKVMKQFVNTDNHSYAKYRVNCVLSRSPRFQKIFNINPGDGMYFDTSDIIF